MLNRRIIAIVVLLFFVILAYPVSGQWVPNSEVVDSSPSYNNVVGGTRIYDGDITLGDVSSSEILVTELASKVPT